VDRPSTKRETAILLADLQAVKRLAETPKQVFLSAGKASSLHEGNEALSESYHKCLATPSIRHRNCQGLSKKDRRPSDMPAARFSVAIYWIMLFW
jgi:hypothetical protein